MRFIPKRIIPPSFVFIALVISSTLNGQVIVVNQSINGQVFNVCSEFFIDSGGQGGPGYSNNENVVFTFCPENLGFQTVISFNLFSLSTIDTNPLPNQSNADMWSIFDGPDSSAPLLGDYIGNQGQGLIIQATAQNTSGCLTLQFVSNDTGSGGYTGTVSCINPNAGCMDSLACNYDSTSNEDDGTCLYPAQSYLTCEGDCLNDEDLNGVCDEIQYSGISSVPQAISYQAAVRSAQGVPLVNQTIQVRLKIFQDSISSAPEYIELHEVGTNNLGLFSVFIGEGMSTLGNFRSIDWSEGLKFLSVEFNTGSDFQLIGTQQLVSVPYAQHSRTSSTIKNRNLPVFENNSQAINGGLTGGDLYRTSNGDLKIVF